MLFILFLAQSSSWPFHCLIRFNDLTEDEKEAIAKEVRDTGILRKDILKKYGVTSQKKLKSFMKRQALSDLSEEQLQAILREVQESSLPTSIIGRKYGIPGAALKRLMKENGIEQKSFKRHSGMTM